MVKVRLFANLREAAGSGSIDVAGETVGEVLDTAAAEYGDQFAAGLAQAKVWVNGEPADPETIVTDRDEVALIPPVSGGAVVLDEDLLMRVLMSGALLAALVFASAASEQVFAVIVVAVVAAWVWDLASYATGRGLLLNPYPLLLAAIAPAWGAYRWGLEGFGFAAILGLVATLIWALFQPPYRSVDSIAYTGLVALLVASVSGPLMLLQLRNPDEVKALVFVVAAAVVASLLATLLESRVPLLDPNLAALFGALLGGAIAGAFWGSSFVVIVLASVVAAVGLVAGRAVGSLLRLGEIALVDTAPGYLTLLDGPLFAVGLFWVTLAVLG